MHHATDISVLDQGTKPQQFEFKQVSSATANMPWLISPQRAATMYKELEAPSITIQVAKELIENSEGTTYVVTFTSRFSDSTVFWADFKNSEKSVFLNTIMKDWLENHFIQKMGDKTKNPENQELTTLIQINPSEQKSKPHWEDEMETVLRRIKNSCLDDFDYLV